MGRLKHAVISQIRDTWLLTGLVMIGFTLGTIQFAISVRVIVSLSENLAQFVEVGPRFSLDDHNEFAAQIEEQFRADQQNRIEWRIQLLEKGAERDARIEALEKAIK